MISPGLYLYFKVVLGGDSPLGASLIAGLEKEGYIVITSVSDPDSVAVIEANGNGFVRALVYDPSEVRLSCIHASELHTDLNPNVAFYSATLPSIPESDT